MSRRINAGYLLVLSAGTLWGTIGLFVKQMGLNGSTPVITSFLRVFFAALIMLPLCLVRGGRRSLHIGKKAFVFCVVLGIVCHGVYNILYSLAVTLTGVSISAVLLNIAPVFTLLFSALLFLEHITGQKILAIIVNIFGCILAVTNGKLDAASFSVIGILFGVGAGLCYVMTAIFGRLAAEQADPFVMSLYSYLAAAVLLFLWARPWSQGIAISANVLIWGFLFALIPTSTAYILYYWGLQKINESSKVPVIASVETIVAALIGTLLYRERLGVVSILGVLLVMGSILLMNQSGITPRIQGECRKINGFKRIG